MLNFGTSVLFLVVTTSVAIVATPVLVKALGEAAFGGYRVVFDGFGMLSILEFGLGGALGPLFARALNSGDERDVQRTAGAGIRAFVKVSLGTVVIGLAVTPFVHLAARNVTPAIVADLRRAWMLGLVSFCSLALSPMRNLVDARQNGYVINLTLTVQSLVVTGLSIVLAKAGWGITGQALALVTGVWLFNLVMTAVALRAHPGLLRAAVVAPVDDEARAAMRGLSTPSLWFGICGRVGFLTDNLVVSRILGFEAVTALVNTQKLVVLGQTVLQSIGNASWAALSDLHVRGEHALFNRRLIEMTRLVALLGAVGFVPVVAYNRVFFQLWLKGAGGHYGGDLVVAIAAVNAVLLAEHSLWGWCFAATGKIRELVPLSIVATTLNLAASILLTYRYGLVGPLLGTTFGFAVVGFWLLVWRLNRSFGTPVMPLLWAVAWPLTVGALASAALWWWLFGHEPADWMGLILAMSASGLVMLALSIVVLMTRDDRALWRLRLATLPFLRHREVVK
jgi:O-antigen/teichoic acid export membrane protein